MKLYLTAAVMVGLIAGAGPLCAQTDSERYSIMRPEKGGPVPYEPWLAPKYRSPRSDRQPVIAVPENPKPPRSVTAPPPVVSPQTGRVIPNLPGASSAEGFQDRAARCAHQAGINGEQGAYIGACINQ